MDITEAKQLIEEEKKERAAICEKELLQVIEKHNCIFQIDLKTKRKPNITQLTNNC
jgi:hypothetical protein